MPEIAGLGTVPLSLVRSHGDFVFVSGTVGRDPGGTIPSDFERQTHLAITELSRLLVEEGAALETVLKTTVFLPAQADFAQMNQIYAEHFKEPWPARSTLFCGLALPELRFEIEAIAHRLN
jgi:2-iminobutanoate/2-iminopropanoate deaminase